MKKSIGTLLVLAVAASVMLSAVPAGADPHRQTCGVRDDGLDRLVEDLAKVLVIELANSIRQRQYQYQPQYAPSPYPGGYGGYQPAPAYAQPMMMQQPMDYYGSPCQPGPIVLFDEDGGQMPVMGYIRGGRIGYPVLGRVIDRPKHIYYGFDWRGELVGPLGYPTPGANEGQRLINAIVTGAPKR